MDIEKLINEANPDLLIFLLATIVAFISWLVKSLVERPITESKSTFIKYFDKRVEILTEVKSRLNFVAYFPKGIESLEYKYQLQTLLLTDGKAAYLSKEIYDNVLRISIDQNTNEVLLLSTIKVIDEELYKIISKIQEEINFYRRFSNYNPLKRFIGITFLSFQYILSLSIVLFLLFIITTTLYHGNIFVRIGVILIGVLLMYFIDKGLKR